MELHAAPNRRHRSFALVETRFRIRTRDQRGRDLGARMHRALERALRRNRAAILIGSDCPALAPQHLRAAARSLRGGCDAVLAPAEDGGYALIGLRRPMPSLFEAIDWGSPAVFEQTRARLARLGVRWRTLEPVWDVDRPEDLDRLARLPLTRATGPVGGAC